MNVRECRGQTDFVDEFGQGTNSCRCKGFVAGRFDGWCKSCGHKEDIHGPDERTLVQRLIEDGALREFPAYEAARIAEVWAEERLAPLREALVQIRDVLADSCPAWALEWDKVTEIAWGDGGEAFTVQEVRDAAREVLDPIAAIVNAALSDDPVAALAAVLEGTP